jgi:diguanylate cyclase (GGDEF)-like protein/PAS domain S-box-containing protein
MPTLPATILIVDDEITDRKLLDALLRPEGYVTRRAANGAEALASIAEHPPDLILLDQIMPGMDGLQVASILKANPATVSIPIIIVTAIVDRNARLAGLKAGAEDFLTKPVDCAELWLKVRNLLRLKAYADLLHDQGAVLEQKVLERTTQLRASELQFRQMAENIGDIFYLVDAQSDRVLYVSPAYEQISGRSCNSLLASPASWSAWIHPEDRSLAEASIRNAVAAGQSEIEYRVLRPDGSIRWIESRCFPVRDNSGQLVRVAGVAKDITERKIAAQELRASEGRFSDMLGSVELASVMLDLQGHITYCNDYLLRLTGWKREDVVGEDWFQLIAAPMANTSTGFFEALKADHAPTWRRENEIVTRTGARRRMLWSNSILHSGTGELIGTASIGEDITERKEAEARIAYLNRVYAVLSGISALIVRASDRRNLLNEACRIAVDQGGFHIATMRLLDSKNQKILLSAEAGRNHLLLSAVRSIVASGDVGSSTMIAQAMSGQTVVVSNNLHDDNQIQFGPEFAGIGIRSMAALPLIVDNVAVGAIALYAGEKEFFHSEEVKLLTELAGDIAFAIENISRQQKLARLARTRTVSGDINSAIIRIRDRSELFKEACRVAVDAGHFRLAWIGIANYVTNNIEPVASGGDELGHLSMSRPIARPARSGPSGLGAAVMATGKHVVCNDIEADTTILIYPSEAFARGYRSAIAVPLQLDGKPIGALYLYAGETQFFDPEEIALLDEVAENLSFAIDHIDRQARLDYFAYYDTLTGLANRSLFLERVAIYMRTAAVAGHKLDIYLIDIERFKNINDNLGQPAGDALLKQVAAWLTQSAGDTSLVGRLEADRFAVALPRTSEGGNLMTFLETATVGLMDHPFRLDESVLRIAAKIGIAIYPDDALDADTLLKNAEAAVKRAKAVGDRFMYYSESMTTQSAGTFTLENQLREAIDKEQFVLHYQPKVSLSTGRVTGVEALIRWNDPRTGLVPPGRFIPVLEETGMIYEVGRWAMRTAIAQFLRWRAAGLAAVRIAVNVSPLQLRNRGFVDEIRSNVDIDPFAAEGLELEITESMIMEDIKHNVASLRAIRDMGVRIAIDDFGTGFSSLSYLSKLPVDSLKIDRSFVTEMTTDATGLELVSMIIKLAQALRLKVVAEGVETTEQSQLLKLLNCDEMQGFLFSKPVPVDVFEARFLTINEVARGPSENAPTWPHPHLLQV